MAMAGGAVEAFVTALNSHRHLDVRVLDYHEHAVGTGTDAKAVSYMEMKVGDRELWGVGMHSDITTASLRAIISGINRSHDNGRS